MAALPLTLDAPVAFQLSLSNGTLSALRFGQAGRPLVLCVPGLSANAWSFGLIGTALADQGYEVVALDLRGRGHSAITAPGTYGWPNHARDILEAASLLGAEQFDLVGHSMGAFISMNTVALAASRVRRLALIDAVCPPEAAALPPIIRGLSRLEQRYDSADTYVAGVKNAGVVTPWDATWDQHYRYELVQEEDGVRPRTSSAAVREDLTYGGEHDASTFWSALKGPVLLLRATEPMSPQGERLINERDAERFAHAVPHALCTDVEANHYGVMTHPQTLQSLRAFFTPAT